jgi:predicted nucleotidyltransferase
VKPTGRWRHLLDERLREAVTLLGQTPGVHGIIVAGSVGRGEPWPMSDIDLLPVYHDAVDPAESAIRLDQRRAALVDWWAASGRAQSLDVGRLAFTTTEIRDAVAAGPDHAVARFGDLRWFHGIDKAYGGHAADPGDELGAAFAGWIGAVRFHPVVVTARIDTWHRQATEAFAEATRVRTENPTRATHLLRESARALRLVLIERWGERLGSMGREWTRFERMADRHGHRALAARIATLAAADPATAAHRAGLAPPWLQERIDLSYGARIAVGEDVSRAENARDQIAAFTVHVVRHRPDLDGPWTGTPDVALDAHLAELRELITRHRPAGSVESRRDDRDP